MHRADLEAAILHGLQHRLLDDRLTKIFCEEYAAHMNRLRGENSAQRDADKAEHAKIERELNRLVQAIMDGVPPGRVKDKIAELEARKDALDVRLATASEDKVRIHPNMAGYYRKTIADLRPALTDPDSRPQAVEIVRKLIDRIVLTPVEDGEKKTLSITLEGHMAGILAMATNAKAPLDESDASVKVTKLVAGAGFEPATFRL